jgi:hypothetical protein
MDDVITCSICSLPFNDPRALHCLHTFCLTCISNWAKTSEKQDAVECPLCREETRLNGRSIEVALKPNYVAIGILDKMKNQSQKEMCDFHENEKGVIYCKTCKKKTKQLAQLESNYEQMIKQNEQLEKDIQLLKENRKKQQEYFETELKKQKEKIEMLEKEKQNAAQKQMDLMKEMMNAQMFSLVGLGGLGLGGLGGLGAFSGHGLERVGLDIDRGCYSSKSKGHKKFYTLRSGERRKLFTGPKGGRFYYTSGGNKRYI